MAKESQHEETNAAAQALRRIKNNQVHGKKRTLFSIAAANGMQIEQIYIKSA